MFLGSHHLCGWDAIYNENEIQTNDYTIHTAFPKQAIIKTYIKNFKQEKSMIGTYINNFYKVTQPADACDANKSW